MKILALYKPAHQNPPTPEMMAKMNAFIDELSKAGKLIATEGRKAGGLEVKIRMRKGQLSVTDGPFTEAKELIAGFAIVSGVVLLVGAYKLSSAKGAIAAAVRHA